MVLLLVMGATSVRPSNRLMAATEGDGGAAGQPAQSATLKPVVTTSPDIPFSDYDSEAEQQLLDLANQSRAQAGAPRLTLDAGLSQAARVHAEAMFAARQLSHQFEGERRPRLQCCEWTSTSHAFPSASRESSQPGV
jgi:uncharacterized protein YkwD